MESKPKAASNTLRAMSAAPRATIASTSIQPMVTPSRRRPRRTAAGRWSSMCELSARLAAAGGPLGRCLGALEDEDRDLSRGLCLLRFEVLDLLGDLSPLVGIVHDARPNCVLFGPDLDRGVRIRLQVVEPGGRPGRAVVRRDDGQIVAVGPVAEHRRPLLARFGALGREQKQLAARQLTADLAVIRAELL